MRFAKPVLYSVGLAVALGYCYYRSSASFTSNPDKNLRDDLVSIVSSKVGAVSLCPVEDFGRPQQCVPLSDASKNSFIASARQVEQAFEPDHPQTLVSFLIKISTVGEEGHTETVHCFLGRQIQGKTGLYLSNVDAGKNCSNPMFSFAVGGAKMPDFLHPPG